MKKHTPRISLVIPLFNNEQTLVSQVTACLRILDNLAQKYEVLVCDDTSTDFSATLLKKHFARRSRVRLLFHGTNQGIAKTIYELYSKATKDYVLLYSVDGDWDPRDIGRLLTKLALTHADIVLGQRDKSVYSFYRSVISHGYNTLTRLLFGVDTVDAGSIKLFKRSLFSRSPIASRSMFFEAEMIIRAVRSGANMAVVPVRFYKKPGDGGRGALLPSVIESLRDAIRLRLTGV